MPFATEYLRDIHFTKHGRKVGAADAIEYETMADAFMFGAMSITMRECIQATGVNRLRYNFTNRYLGVALAALPELLKTFHPAHVHTVRHHGGHTSYFQYECGRTDV